MSLFCHTELLKAGLWIRHKSGDGEEFKWPGFSVDIHQWLLDINVCCQLLNDLALMLYNLIAAAIASIYNCQNKEEICSITLITCMSSLVQRHIIYHQIPLDASGQLRLFMKPNNLSFLIT